MENNQGILIFGATGLIGSHLYNLLKKAGKLVIGTYHEDNQEGLFYFDITKSSIKELPLSNISCAVICSAITKLEDCKNNPEYSRRVNVDGTEKIIIELSRAGIIPVFLSSGAVFDGAVGGYKEESPRHPLSLYGEQKLEVEDFMKKNIKDYLIIRPGKVWEFEKVFLEWLEKYKNHETILCADDEKLAFTSPEDVARGIALLMQRNSRGIYNLNSPIHCSRWDLANEFFKKLGIKDAKIKACSIDDFGAEKRAKNSFMDASKFIGETGFQFTKLDEIIDLIDKI